MEARILISIKTTEHLQTKNFMLNYCFHAVYRIFNTIIKMERQIQNNLGNDALLTPGNSDNNIL